MYLLYLRGVIICGSTIVPNAEKFLKVNTEPADNAQLPCRKLKANKDGFSLLIKPIFNILT